eukprot:scaffold5328_cov215-Pinguiococcus_pyrenoidosus.AAC.2
MMTPRRREGKPSPPRLVIQDAHRRSLQENLLTSRHHPAKAGATSRLPYTAIASLESRLYCRQSPRGRDDAHILAADA